MKRSSEFWLGAIWTVRQIRKKLPLQSHRRGSDCECSADLVYYLEEILNKIERAK